VCLKNGKKKKNTLKGSRKDEMNELKEDIQLITKSSKTKIIRALEDIYKYHLKVDKRRSLSLFYHHHNKYIWLWLILVLVPVLFFYLIVRFFKIELTITSSFVFSIIALFISIMMLSINIVRIMDYPIDNLTINRLNHNENFYELQFSIKNCGHGKLRLDYAIYFIEELDINEIKELQTAQDKVNLLENTAITKFLYNNYEKISEYLEKLIHRIKNSNINAFSLKEITKFCNIYYTHDDEHIETRVHKFEPKKIYFITFLFRTTHKVFFYISKHILT